MRFIKTIDDVTHLLQPDLFGKIADTALCVMVYTLTVSHQYYWFIVLENSLVNERLVESIPCSIHGIIIPPIGINLFDLKMNYSINTVL